MVNKVLHVCKLFKPLVKYSNYMKLIVVVIINNNNYYLLNECASHHSKHLHIFAYLLFTRIGRSLVEVDSIIISTLQINTESTKKLSKLP